MPKSLFDDPMEWFDVWFQDACDAGIKDANAMVLSTVAASGRPSSRVVLLKDHGVEGFVFYTNYDSRKGAQLRSTAVAALNFFWRDLDRQIRVEGAVERVEEAESDAYFATRPRGSQIGAWASAQSQPLASRESLVERVADCERRFDGEPVPRPAHWGGFRLVANRIEFWQAGEYRLHDRWEFQRSEPEQAWTRVRLNP